MTFGERAISSQNARRDAANVNVVFHPKGETDEVQN